ncbi:hypothetical protein BGZ93_008536 [Podila epicladia]|nr:hypothetical protein BGZ92_001750 [Podila epicladia]KAG0092010.1 hypothetical protein BGZ93_008536 [Podila epicladia]
MARSIPESTVEEVKQLKEQGHTNRAAAEATGISSTSVDEIPHEEGLPVGSASRLKELSDDTADELAREHQIGVDQTDAEGTDRANEMQNEPVSHSTARRSMHDVEDAQEPEMTQSHQETSGLPGRKKLPDETLDELVRERAAHEIGSSYKEAHEKANEMLEDPVSYSTVRRCLHEAEDN